MATTAPTPDLKEYKGNCHCGAVKYTVQLPELKDVNACNCSICKKNNNLWVFPDMKNVTFTKGANSMKTYTFGGGKLKHKFCPKCGTVVVGTRDTDAGPDSQGGLNVHAMEDVDFWALTIKPFDGAALPANGYAPAVVDTAAAEAQKAEGEKVYTGSCHCGKVTVAMHSKPLPELNRIIECDCSICARTGAIWAYPSKEQVLISNASFLTPYQNPSAAGKCEFMFCPVCSVCVYNAVAPPTEDPNWSAERKAFVARQMSMMPVNINILDGVEAELPNLIKHRGSKDGKKYVVPE